MKHFNVGKKCQVIYLSVVCLLVQSEGVWPNVAPCSETGAFPRP